MPTTFIPPPKPKAPSWLPGWMQKAVDSLQGPPNPTDVVNPMEMGAMSGSPLGSLAGMIAGVAFPAAKRVFRGATAGKMLMKNPEGFINFAEDAAHASQFANKPGGAVMPAHLNVSNALDLTPEGLGSVYGTADAAGDIKKLEGFIPSELQNTFKKNKTYWRGNDPDARYEGRQAILSLIEQIQRNNPHFLQDAGFDGLRYIDGATPAWAVLDPSQIEMAVSHRKK